MFKLFKKKSKKNIDFSYKADLTRIVNLNKVYKNEQYNKGGIKYNNI